MNIRPELTNTASLSKFHYETSDFSEVGCKSIVNLSQATTEDVELQLGNSPAATGLITEQIE